MVVKVPWRLKATAVFPCQVTGPCLGDTCSNASLIDGLLPPSLIVMRTHLPVYACLWLLTIDLTKFYFLFLLNYSWGFVSLMKKHFQ